MATTTTNLGLTKPAVSDAADISVLNANFDKIDEQFGYGMGKKVKILTSAADLHTLTVPGRYGWGSDAPQNAPAPYMVMELMFRDTSCTYGVANFYTTTPYPIYEKYGRIVISSGEWGVFEWENPPMSLGVEYRTTERYLGYPVYKKAVSVGALPNASNKLIDVSSVGIGWAVKATLVGADNNLFAWTNHPNVNGVFFTASSLQIHTTADLSAFNANCILEYTK